MQNLRAIIAKLGKATLISTVLTLPVLADHNEHYNRHTHQYEHTDDTFRQEHPFRVYINIRNRQRANRHHDNRRDYHRNQQPAYTALTMKKLTYSLPEHIILVADPDNADMVVRVRQNSYDLNFHVVDVDEKSKRYKKHRRYTHGKCGVFSKAYYTKIKEKGEENVRYSVKFQIDGFNPQKKNIHLRSSEKYSYGQNLTAKTNCGVRSTQHMPSKDVRKLFHRATPDYRQHVANNIRKETAADLGRTLALQIKSKANKHYAALATRLAHADHGDDDYRYKRTDYDWVTALAHLIIREERFGR